MRSQLVALSVATIITIAAASVVYYTTSATRRQTSFSSGSGSLNSQVSSSSAFTSATQSSFTSESFQTTSTASLGGLIPTCGTGQTLLSVLPISLNDTVLITPLGAMVPPDHVFPAPHLYVIVLDYLHPVDKHATFHAPGDMVLASLGLRHYNTLGNKTNFLDYTLVFYVCDKLVVYFHHVTTLSYQPFVDAASKVLQTCSFSTQRNEDFCQGETSIPVKAGTVIGTVGDINAGSYGLDIGARDLRLADGVTAFVDPARACPGNESNIFDRCYAVCPFDYYPESIRSQLKFEASDGTVRTTPPVCGTLFLDVKGTAQGYWYGAQSTNINSSPEANNLYLGPDNVNTTLSIFSLGTAISGTQPGKYVFVASTSAGVNPRFAQVLPGNVNCFETRAVQGSGYQPAPNTTVFLTKLVDQSTLQVQASALSSCGSGPWNLDAPVTFSR